MSRQFITSRHEMWFMHCISALGGRGKEGWWAPSTAPDHGKFERRLELIGRSLSHPLIKGPSLWTDWYTCSDGDQSGQVKLGYEKEITLNN